MRILEGSKKKEFGADNINTEYFAFLCKIIASEPTSFYWTLFTKDFTWTLQDDAKHASTGKKLREAFINKYPYKKSQEDLIVELEDLKGPCSVFEMLIGLSIDIEMFTSGKRSHDYEPRYTKATFNEMINNLRLNRMAKDDATHNLNTTLLNMWLERTFSKYGGGSPFPIKWKTCPDQRIRPIWDQAVSYLGENYFIGDMDDEA